MAVMAGKQIVYNFAFVVNIVSWLFLVVAFCTPYWVMSWPRVYNPFRAIGLWTACLYGLILEWDVNQKGYYGCWWILSPEFYGIRNWLMPGWFVVTQIIVTLCGLAEFVNLVLMLVQWLRRNRRKRPDFRLVQAITVMNIVCAVLMSIAMLIFGVCVYTDYYWMPNMQLNYLGWSYGCAVASAILSIASSIPLVVYNRIVRDEFRMAPPVPDDKGFLPISQQIS